jgi:hypothetical protein
MISLKTLGAGYLASHAFYGFYRGYNNLYPKDALMHRPNCDLYIDKIVNGVFSSVMYVNPGLHPYSMYYILRRTEKNLRGKPLDEEDWRC